MVKSSTHFTYKTNLVFLVFKRSVIVNDDDFDGDDDDDAPVVEGNVECFLGKTVVRQTWVSAESVWP